jgi:hypothetical protein
MIRPWPREKSFSAQGGDNVAQSTTGDELALAGKGFNEHVEREYKSKHPGADSAAIQDDDPAAAAYLEKCRLLEKDPPSDWQGIWLMSGK